MNASELMEVEHRVNAMTVIYSCFHTVREYVIVTKSFQLLLCNMEDTNVEAGCDTVV